MRDAIQQEEQNTMLLAESDGCAVWQLRNETGEGTVTCYTIFPGVELRFRDLHMTHCVCGKTDDVCGSRSSTAAKGAWPTRWEKALFPM